MNLHGCYIRYNNSAEFRAAEAFFIANGYSWWSRGVGPRDSLVTDCVYKTIGIIDQYIVYNINTDLYDHLREIKLKNVYLKEYFK